TCQGDTTHWRFVVSNTGTATLPEITVVLANPEVNSLSLIDNSSISTTSTCITCTHGVSASTPLVLPVPLSTCSTNTPNPLSEFTILITDLKPNESVEILFNEYHCCTEHEDLFNTPKYFNQWRINSFTKTACDHILTQSAASNAAITPSQGISGHSFTVDKDVNPEVDFYPTTTHITVSPPNGSVYFANAPTFYQMDFNNTFGDLHDQQALGFSSTNATPVSGFIKVEIGIDQGLMISNPKHVFFAVPNTVSGSGYIILHNVGYEQFPCTTYDPNPLLDNGIPVTTLVQDLQVSIYPPCTTVCESSVLNPYILYYRISDLVSAGLPANDIPLLFNQGKFIFGLTACCDIVGSPTAYTVKFSILPNEACFNFAIGTCTPAQTSANCCWLPLAKKGGETFIHCPGCLAPGAIVDNYSIYRTSLGYADATNDGIADNTSTLQYFPGTTAPGSPYWPHYSQLDLHKSVFGDELEDYMIGHFDPGADPLGYSYSTMLSHGIELNVLQLYREFKFSGLLDYNVQVTGFDFYIDNPVTTIPANCIDCPEFNSFVNPYTTVLKFSMDFATANGTDISQVFSRNPSPDDARMLFTFEESALSSFYNNLPCTNCGYDLNLLNGWNLSTDIDYSDHQQYRLRVRYKVCGNKQSQLWNADPNDLESKADITDFIWMRGEKELLSNIPDVGHITSNQMPNTIALMEANPINLGFPGSSCLNSPPTCSVADQNSLGNSFFFYCEPSGSSHYFLSTDYLNDTRYARIEDLNDPDCKAVIEINSKNSFRRKFTTNSSFKKEYRIPRIFPSDLTVELPPDWTWNKIGNNVNMTVRSYACNGSTACFHTSAPVPLTGITGAGNTISFSLNTPFNSQPFICRTSQTTNNDLFIADELSFQQIRIYLEPSDCANFTIPAPLIPSTFSQVEFSLNQQDCSTLSTCSFDPVTVPNYFPQYLLLIRPPNPNLAFNLSPLIFNANSGTVSWNFNLNNYSTSSITATPARNVYIGHDNPLPGFLQNWNVNYSRFNASNILQQQYTLNGFQSGNYFWLNPTAGTNPVHNALPANHYYSGTITADITDCNDLPVDIEFKWGWNCFSTTDPPNVADHCKEETAVVTLNSIPGILSTDAFSYFPTEYTACNDDPVLVTACFKNEYYPEVLPGELVITLQPGSIVNIVNAPQIVNCSTGSTSYSIGSTTGTNSWEIVNGSNYMGLNDCFCVEFEITTDGCNIGPLQMPLVSINGEDICEAPLTCDYSLPFMNPSGYSDCTDCYEIYKFANPTTAYVGEYVNFDIVICANNSVNAPNSVNLDDLQPANFAPDPPVSFPISGFATPPSGCITYTVSGIFTDAGPCDVNVNTATIEFGNPVNTLSAEACVLVNCPLGTPIVGPITTSSYFGIIPGSQFTVPSGTYSLSGELIIDNLIEFDNCTLIVASDGFITVNTNMSLSFVNNSLVEGCPTMWQGIIMQQRSNISLTRTMIRDADIAIAVNDDCTVYSDAAAYLDCIIGINVLPNGNPSNFNNVSLRVFDSKFGRVLPQFKNSFPGQNAHGLFGRAGILLHDMAMVTIGDNQQAPNEFFNLNFGVELHNSNADITNSRFHDIVADGAYAQYGVLKPFGCAVTARRDLDKIVYLNVFPLASSGINTIENSQVGVYSNFYNKRVTGVKMSNVYKGVQSEQSRRCIVNINSCDINAIYRGIDWSDNDGSTLMVAQGNTITVEPSGTGNFKGAAC
ncbi:MAG: hypothetical protein RL348_813, partial [Bacteroidota bacterium]